ncbi:MULTISPECIES: zinc-ribbon domain-containing protein [unclassified Bradyrhizobium]
MTCPYCQAENADNALVCASCGRDIAVPATLIAERDDLLRKRDQLRDELTRARDEVEAIMRRRKSR